MSQLCAARRGGAALSLALGLAMSMSGVAYAETPPTAGAHDKPMPAQSQSQSQAGQAQASQAQADEAPVGKPDDPGMSEDAPVKAGKSEDAGQSEDAPVKAGKSEQSHAPAETPVQAGKPDETPVQAGHTKQSAALPEQASEKAVAAVAAARERQAQNENAGQGDERGNGHTPVNICHATGSDTNPYVFITVDKNAVSGHENHNRRTGREDVIGVESAADCPAGTNVGGNDNEPNGPKDGDTTKPEKKDKPGKVTICHATASDTNPYVVITISESALDAHLANHDRGDRADIVLEEGQDESDCPVVAGGGDENEDVTEQPDVTEEQDVIEQPDVNEEQDVVVGEQGEQPDVDESDVVVTPDHEDVVGVDDDEVIVVDDGNVAVDTPRDVAVLDEVFERPATDVRTVVNAAPVTTAQAMPDTLPFTGSSNLTPLLLNALGAVGLGGLLMGTARRRQYAPRHAAA